MLLIKFLENTRSVLTSLYTPLNLNHIYSKELIGLNFKLFKDLLWRESMISAAVKKEIRMLNLSIASDRCSLAVEATKATGVVPETCLDFLNNPFERAWAHDVDIETVDLVCDRFDKFFWQIGNSLDDYSEITEVLNEALADCIEVEAFILSRTGKEVDSMKIQSSDFNAIKELFENEDFNKATEATIDIGNYEEKKEEEGSSTNDPVINTINQLNKIFAVKVDTQSFIDNLIAYGVGSIDTGLTAITAGIYPTKQLERLFKLCLRKINNESLATAKLIADFRSANGVENVQFNDCFPYPTMVNPENDDDQMQKFLPKLSKIIDKTLFMYLADLHKIDLESIS
jgi:hypothetical protein